MLEIGSVIGGKYKILHRIGHGGMSNVYLAMNEKANKQWAVKEVRRDGGKNQEVIRQNLIAETSILRELRHPHLPSIVDIIQDDDSYLILMDYIEGITLSKKLNAEGAQPEEDVVKWAMQICDVLGYLHSRTPKIIYRDTKPSNIMLKPNGDVVLIDFGTARVYKETSDEDTSWLGTRGYAAPEQFGGHGQTDERTDIYNLGATMYHLVTGHNPSQYPYEMYPIRHWDKNLSSGLEFIIQKCTRNNPQERYQNCAELMYALEHYVELEEGYQKKQSKQMAIFIATALLSLSCFAGSFITGHIANSMTNETYDAYIKDAEGGTTDEVMVENYLKAIEVNPSNVQAYEELIDRVFLKDGIFSKEEAEKLTSILGAKSSTSNGNNESAIKQNAEAYEEFAYKMGLVYFYYYEGSGNKPMSQPWFEIARNGTHLDEVKTARAERFYKIADYYTLLSNKDKAGDNAISYKDYWADIKDLTSGDLVDEDNEKTAIVMYKEVAYQTTMHANDFRRAGVSKEDIVALLDSISARIDTDLQAVEPDEAEQIEALKKTVAEAYQAVETSYEANQEADVIQNTDKQGEEVFFDE